MTTLSGLVFPMNALPAAQLAGQGIDRLSHSAELKARALIDYYDRVAADLMFIFSDIVIQAEAMGARAVFAPGAMPTVVAPAAAPLLPRARDVERMVINARAMAELGRAHPHRPRAAMVYGPFTVAGQVAGEQAVLRGTVERPAEVRALLDKCTTLAVDYAALLLEAGAQVLWISDPLAALLPPADFSAFAGEYLARVYAAHPTAESALHICGDTGDIVRAMADTGVGAISFDQCLDLLALEDQVPPEVTILGNLDPVDLLEMAAPEEVARQAADLTAAMGVLPNFGLCTGCAPPPTAAVDNLAAMCDAGRRAFTELAPFREDLAGLAARVFRGDRAPVAGLVRELLDQGAPPMTVIASGLMRAVQKGSACYEAKRFHLPAVLLMVDAFYEGYRQVEARLGAAGEGPPRVVLGTVKGDIHEIGKNLVAIILEAHGVRTLDLGVNVPPERFLEACREHGAPVVGLSAFITSARKEIAGVVELFRDQGMHDVAVLAGGAAVNQQLADSLGADGYARDAVSAVKLAKKVLAQRGGPA